MGLGQERLRPGDSGGRIAAAGQILLLFCPSMKQPEILNLKEHNPALYQRALALEANAMPNLKTIKGLGRNYSWQERFGKE